MIYMCPLCFHVETRTYIICPKCKSEMQKIPGTPVTLTARWNHPKDFKCNCCDRYATVGIVHTVTAETIKCNGAVISAHVHNRNASVSHHLGHGFVGISFDFSPTPVEGFYRIVDSSGAVREGITER